MLDVSSAREELRDAILGHKLCVGVVACRTHARVVCEYIYMNMYVCMHVCMYVSVYVCVCVLIEP
jgi:hypothetical protein